MAAIAISAVFVVIAAAIGLLCDGAIIYSVFRFRRLRTVANIFLANWAISDMCSIIMLPTVFVAGGLMFGMTTHEYSCILIHLVVILHFGSQLFGILMMVDWCMAAYFHAASEKLRKRYTIPIAAIWIIVLLFYSISTGLCVSHLHYFLMVDLFILTYALNMAFLIVLQVVRLVKKFRTPSDNLPNLLTFRLTVITVISCGYLLGTIQTCMLYYGMYDHFGGRNSLAVVTVLSIIFVLCNSAVTLGVLCWLDKDFRFCLFPKNSGDHERFENESSETESNPNKESTAVTYNNPNQRINQETDYSNLNT